MPLTPEQIGKLICAHTGQRVSLRTDEIHQYFDFARALLAQLEAQEAPAVAALSQPVHADSQCAECNGTRKVDGWPCPICCPTDDGPDERKE